MKKTSLLLLSLLLFGCSQPTIKEAKGTYENSKGEVTTANIKMQDEKLQEVELDESTKDRTKKTLKEEYGMKAASSIGKEWYEQAMFFEDYVEKNGLDKITLDDEGKATNEDILTGCTIKIDGFIKAIDDAQKNAKSQ